MKTQLMNKFLKEETGAPIIELVILIAMAAVIAAVLFPNLRNAISGWTNDMFANITAGLTGQDPDAGYQNGTPDADVDWTTP